MALTIEGFSRDGKIKLREHVPGDRLVFYGPDKEYFKQVNPPEQGNAVRFELTIVGLMRLGLAPVLFRIAGSRGCPQKLRDRILDSYGDLVYGWREAKVQ